MPNGGGILDMVQGEGFEPSKAKPADLQSALVDRLSNPAYIVNRGATCRIRTDDPRFTKPML